MARFAVCLIDFASHENDFNLEIPMYLNSKNIFDYIENLNIKK